MSLLEIAFLSIIILCSLWVFWSAWHSNIDEIFSPRVFFTVLVLYYTVIGPLIYVNGKTDEMMGIYIRPVMWKGWLATAVALGSFLVGYARLRPNIQRVKYRADDKAVLTVSIVFFSAAGYAMLYWMMNYGGGLGFLNPIYSEESALMAVTGFEQVGVTYLAQLINLTFGASTILLLYVLDNRSIVARVLFVATVLISVLFFVKTGFRYRLAWMAVGLTVVYYLWKNRRPKLLFWIPLGMCFIAAMGAIGLTRSYFGGLSLRNLKDAEVSDVFLSGFGESGIFMTLSQVMDAVPRDVPHTTWDPLWVAITYPIPRSLWADKPTSQTLLAIAASFGTNGSYEAGMAVPYYGEWYIAFGWPGIVVSSMIGGWLSRKLWDWYHQFVRDKLATVIYAVALGFIFVAFSRGLLAQAALNFSFGVLPLLLMHRFLPRISLWARSFKSNDMSVTPVQARRVPRRGL